jgi:hypothetical protein
MKPYFANLINAIILIVLSIWGYYLSASPSATAFIPAALGAVLLAFTPGMRSDNKVIAHIVVVLTLVIILALVMPLRGAISRDDTGAIARVAIMMGWGIIAMAVYVKSFIDVRRNK